MSKPKISLVVGVLTLAAAASHHLLSRTSAPSTPAESRAGETKPTRFDLGRTPSAQDFARRGSLVGPDGSGLPKGHGTAAEGRAVYMQSCAACHGQHGEGTNNFPALVGGAGTLKTDHPLPTVGSYWPYATTAWDYINRAMPYTNPGTLKPDEVYAVTAYLLSMNGIIPEAFEMNEQTLPKVKMPNRDGFVADPRPDVK